MPDRLLALRYHLALTVAVLAVSSSAALVRWADAGAVSLAFWRTAGGAGVLLLTGLVVGGRDGDRRLGRRHVPLIVVAGGFLALHFAAWLASLELTSVAASVTLVTTTPLLIAGYRALTGRSPSARTWAGIVLAIAGTAVITAGDLGDVGAGLTGDLLALLGAVAMTGYLLIGERLRAELSTVVYAAAVYGAAAVVLAPVALVVDGGLGGYSRSTWLAIIGMILGPQLAGHTVLNLLLRPLGPVTVSLALLAESVGATLAVWAIFGEVPPVAAVIGGTMVLVALAVHLRGEAGASPGAPVGPSPVGGPPPPSGG
ncbi:MAG: DMT family transporter [Actinomycetota bacterium]